MFKTRFFMLYVKRLCKFSLLIDLTCRLHRVTTIYSSTISEVMKKKTEIVWKKKTKSSKQSKAVKFDSKIFTAWFSHDFHTSSFLANFTIIIIIICSNKFFGNLLYKEDYHLRENQEIEYKINANIIFFVVLWEVLVNWGQGHFCVWFSLFNFLVSKKFINEFYTCHSTCKTCVVNYWKFFVYMEK